MESHDLTKAQREKNKTPEATYSRENNNWKIQEYYNIMSKEFNDPEKDGVVYKL